MPKLTQIPASQKEKARDHFGDRGLFVPCGCSAFYRAPRGNGTSASRDLSQSRNAVKELYASLLSPARNESRYQPLSSCLRTFPQSLIPSAFIGECIHSTRLSLMRIFRLWNQSSIAEAGWSWGFMSVATATRGTPLSGADTG